MGADVYFHESLPNQKSDIFVLPPKYSRCEIKLPPPSAVIKLSLVKPAFAEVVIDINIASHNKLEVHSCKILSSFVYGCLSDKSRDYFNALYICVKLPKFKLTPPPHLPRNFLPSNN